MEKKELMDGWFTVLENPVFHSVGLKGLIKVGDQVFPLWEQMKGDLVVGKLLYFVPVLTEDMKRVCVELRTLSLPEKKKEELVTFCGIKPSYFKSALSYDFDLSLDRSMSLPVVN